MNVELTQAELISQIELLRGNYLRCQANLIMVIQELEADLNRMRSNERIPHELVVKKDEQIENLVKLNNTIDDLFNLQKIAITNLKLELVFTHKMLWDAIKSDKTAFEVMMHRMVHLPKQAPK